MKIEEKDEVRHAANQYLRTRWEGNASTREALSRAREADTLFFVGAEPFILVSRVASLGGLSLRQLFRRGGIIIQSEGNILNMCLPVKSLSSASLSRIRFKDDLAGVKRE
ncbi:hypothetical protein M1394_01030 [Candidatus Marsarchaeota archaeon]|nr:hypothetical protein [Candidatus Marsarchaeota archaeon]